jgi:hypothetical protein
MVCRWLGLACAKRSNAYGPAEADPNLVQPQLLNRLSVQLSDPSLDSVVLAGLVSFLRGR